MKGFMNMILWVYVQSMLNSMAVFYLSNIAQACAQECDIAFKQQFFKQEINID